MNVRTARAAPAEPISALRDPIPMLCERSAMRRAILAIRAARGVQFAPPLRVDWGKSSHHGCVMNAAVAGGYESPWMNEELAIFRDAVVRFIESEMVPNEMQWRKQQNVGKEIWRKA